MSSQSPTPLALPVPLHTETVHFQVTDPEVVEELRRHPAGEGRNQFAAQALRIGVLALRTAGGQLDAAAIREAGVRLVADMKEVLGAKATEMATTLGQYLDPRNGSFAQRVESLVKRDGDLERVLREQVGIDNSVLARSLAQHIGDQSPLLRMLSPSDAQGLRAQIEAALRRGLEEQRATVLREFSLDQADSALSRLVGRLQLQQGDLQAGLKNQVQAVIGEFSLDKPDSALSRLVREVQEAQSSIAEQFSMDSETSALSKMSRLLGQTSDQIRSNLTLDDERSALSRLKRELVGTIEELAKKNTDFQGEIRAAVASLDARRKADDRGTVHGLDFEARLGSWLEAEARGIGDLHERVGGVAGEVPRSKKGDHVVCLGTDSAAAGTRVVWEAKESQGYTVVKALAEMEEARHNRKAQLGVFVYSRKCAPVGQPPFARHGNDLVVVWDSEDSSTDVVLAAAYSAARALAIREAAELEAHGEIVAAIEKSLRGIEKRLKSLSDIESMASTVENNGRNIGRLAMKAREDLQEHVGVLEVQIAGLKAAGS